MPSSKSLRITEYDEASIPTATYVHSEAGAGKPSSRVDVIVRTSMELASGKETDQELTRLSLPAPRRRQVAIQHRIVMGPGRRRLPPRRLPP
jgi:hypothetical protein